MAKIKLDGYMCERCEHKWTPRENSTTEPMVCPKCKSPYWNRPRGGELKYQWKCPQCSKVIKSNSENTLKINKALHLKLKHK